MGLYNRALFFGTLLAKKLTKGRAPLVVVLNTTFRCNLRCGYCYGKFYERRDKDFTTEELLGLIGDLAAMGMRSITLGGGEPLLRGDIGLLIRRIKSLGVECGMNTNGILIGRKTEELRPIDMVTVSLDGPKEANDANRGQGSFDKIVAGIDAALDAGIKVHTTTVITRHNTGCVDWIVDFARRKKIQAEFNFLFNQAPGKHQSDEFASGQEALSKCAAYIARLKERGAPILFSPQVYDYASRWPDYSKRVIMDRPPSFRHIPCYAGRFMMFIDADGRVYPCVQLIDIFDALDFRKTGIKRAWEHCRTHTCKTCYFPCFNEFNGIMGLNPAIIAGQVASTLKKQ